MRERHGRKERPTKTRKLTKPKSGVICLCGKSWAVGWVITGEDGHTSLSETGAAPSPAPLQIF